MRHRLKQIITAQQEDNFETLTSAFKIGGNPGYVPRFPLKTQ